MGKPDSFSHSPEDAVDLSRCSRLSKMAPTCTLRCSENSFCCPPNHCPGNFVKFRQPQCPWLPFPAAQVLLHCKCIPRSSSSQKPFLHTLAPNKCQFNPDQKGLRASSPRLCWRVEKGKGYSGPGAVVCWSSRQCLGPTENWGWVLGALPPAP